LIDIVKYGILFSVLAQNGLYGQEIKVDEQIKVILESVVADGDSLDGKPPGFVAAIKKHGKPIRIAAAGKRKRLSKESFTIFDQVHIGSCSKAMTATLIGKLVDQNKLSWNTTVPKGLPSIAKHIHLSFKNVTVLDLLQHRGGLQANADDWWSESGKPITTQRFLLAKQHLSRPAKNKRGEYLYSNLGYMIAGLIAEQKTGQTWENLMRQEIFKPLGITSAGFGFPGTKGAVDQPWGHLGLAMTPTQSDNAAALGPAGTIHLSLNDWAKFTQQHCGGQLNKIVSVKTMRDLHKTRHYDKNKYALGWNVLNRPWGNGTVLMHSGSNTMWFATVWVAPNKKTSYLAATNYGGPDMPQLTDQVIYSLVAIDNGVNPPEIKVKNLRPNSVKK
tara:strand:+ start:2596 stop:3759 length:1164 start_codon:yes stop_codon:yes gene_type:complete